MYNWSPLVWGPILIYSASSLVGPLFKYLANGDVFSCKSGTIDGGMLKICMDIDRWLVCVYHHY